jgi:hypothetical protein
MRRCGSFTLGTNRRLTHILFVLSIGWSSWHRQSPSIKDHVFLCICREETVKKGVVCLWESWWELWWESVCPNMTMHSVASLIETYHMTLWYATNFNLPCDNCIELLNCEQGCYQSSPSGYLRSTMWRSSKKSRSGHPPRQSIIDFEITLRMLYYELNHEYSDGISEKHPKLLHVGPKRQYRRHLVNESLHSPYLVENRV